jgi:hypothetical protein
MSWQTFSDADILLSSAESKAAENFGAKIKDVAAMVVSQVRGAIQIHQPVGPATTIPDSLKMVAMNLAIEQILLLCPGSIVSDVRKSAIESAKSILEGIRAGKIRVETPDAPSAEQVSRGQIKTVTTSPRHFSREKTSGL